MDCHESAACIKTKLLNESSSTYGNSWMETLVEEIIPVVMEKYDLNYPDKSI